MVRGPGLLMMKPGVQPGGHDGGGDVRVQVEADQQAFAADLGDAVDAGESGAQVLPHVPDVGQDVAGSRCACSVARAAAVATGFPPKVVPCWPAVSSAEIVRAEGDQRADREAAAQALGEGHGVRDDSGILAGEPFAGAADAGLDLVEDQQGAGLAVRFAGGPQVAGRQRPDAGLALDRFQEDCGGGVIDGSARAPRCHRTGRARRRRAAARTAPGRPPSRSAPGRPWCGRGRHLRAR